MLSALVVVALAGAASAFTPPGIEPSSSNNLTVAFGDTLAVDGVDLPKPVTQTAPTVGTADQLAGTYTLLMVDFDIPPPTPGGRTSQRLHWLQSGLVSSNTSSTVAGQEVYELVNPSNVSAFAPYNGPQPPARAPFSHRYTQFLLNTTENDAALSVLSEAGKTRANFSAIDVVTKAGLTVLAGNWFNVTNTSTPTSGSASPSGTGTGIGGGSTTTPPLTNGGFVAVPGLGSATAALGVSVGAFMVL